MSDVERKDEIEVEGHLSDASVVEEPAKDDDDDVEAHMRLSQVRFD
jgi:hypothetical protein